MNLPNGGDKQVINEGNKAPSNHHNYNLSYKFAATERFGEVSPFVFSYGVPDDKNFTFRCKNELRTLALKSPLLQNVRKNLDYYAVPTQAILPHTWDFIQNNPVIGQDIDPRLVNCLIYLSGEADNITGIKDLLSEALVVGGVVDYVVEDDEFVVLDSFAKLDWDNFVHLLIVLETFFAKDSLMASFRMPLHKRVGIFEGREIQKGLKQAWKFYHNFLSKYAEVASDYIEVEFLDSDSQSLFKRTYNLNKIEQRMRLYYDMVENPYVNWPMSDANVGSVYAAIVNSSTLSYYEELCRNSNEGILDTIAGWKNATTSIDIRPVLAYQLVCAEYFSNDKIDFVYSADMLRKLYEGYFIEKSHSTFELNGNKYPYDAFSAIALSNLLYITIEYDFAEDNRNWYAFSLLINLFTRKRSLRFVDYFTGARSHPIAVGDVNVSVDAQGVSAIDMSKGIQTARYLLAANRVGPKAKSYLKGIFGADMRTRTDVPVKIGHIDEVVYGVETQNTGESQFAQPQSITTNLESRSSDFAFQMDLDEDTLLIGVASYEIPRFYLEGWSKFANKVDRFDHFNPYFQYTGDQPISQSELQAGLDDDSIFGYQSKDTEYKLQTDYAIGDLTDALRGWIFAQEDIENPVIISPDFIRAHQTELDRYFLSMTAEMASERYHFICKYDNQIEASRNMVFDPQILK